MRLVFARHGVSRAILQASAGRTPWWLTGCVTRPILSCLGGPVYRPALFFRKNPQPIQVLSARGVLAGGGEMDQLGL